MVGGNLGKGMPRIQQLSAHAKSWPDMQIILVAPYIILLASRALNLIKAQDLL